MGAPFRTMAGALTLVGKRCFLHVCLSMDWLALYTWAQSQHCPLFPIVPAVEGFYSRGAFELLLAHPLVTGFGSYRRTLEAMMSILDFPSYLRSVREGRVSVSTLLGRKRYLPMWKTSAAAALPAGAETESAPTLHDDARADSENLVSDL
jgi:hypothetical protein